MKENSSNLFINIFDGKTITDSLGRNIELKSPKVMDMYRLKKALREDNDISACVSMMQWVLYVKKVADVNFFIPLSQSEAYAALEILGIEGIAAVTGYIEENSQSDGEEEIKK